MLHRVAGRPMIEYPVALARALGSRRVVVRARPPGRRRARRRRGRFGAGSIEVAHPGRAARHRPRGAAGRAARSASIDGLVLILYGDVPLLTERRSQRLVARRLGRDAGADARRACPIPRGYGRMVRDERGQVRPHRRGEGLPRAEQRRIGEINAGIYCGPARFFFETLRVARPQQRAGRALSHRRRRAGRARAGGRDHRGRGRGGDGLQRSRRPGAAPIASCACGSPSELMRAGVDGARSRAALRRAGRRGRPRHASSAPASSCAARPRSAPAAASSRACVITDCDASAIACTSSPTACSPRATVGNDAQIGPWCAPPPGHASSRTTCTSATSSRPRRRASGSGAKANHLTYLGDADIGAEGQRRLRHHHLQLRRLREVADGDRRRRLHRLGHAARRAGDRRGAARSPPPARRCTRTCRRARWR